MNSDRQSLIDSVYRQIGFFKQPKALEGLFAQAIALQGSGGALLPVAELYRGTRPLGDGFRPEEWLECQDRLAFLVVDRQLQPEAALLLKVLPDLRIELGTFPAAGEADIVGEGIGALAKWIGDTLCTEEVVAASGLSSRLRGSAGFKDGVYRSPGAQATGNAMILTAGPSISNREAAYAMDAAKYGWNREWAKYLNRFETEFAAFVGVGHALACSSCTGALTIALTALDIGPGDEVIVPDLTWVATANAVRYVGATPVFSDIEADTWNIDCRSAERLITDRTKAIIPVHMYGHPARMDQVMRLARAKNLFVIEDAAPAIGAEWQGQRCGTFGHFAAFSFQGAKLLVTGEGGMLVCNDSRLYERAKKIWDQGRDPSRAFWIDSHGVKYKMANIQAAIGLAQLERCTELVAMKRRIFSWYASELDGVKCICLNREVAGARSIYWMSSILLDESTPIGRDALMTELKKRNIDTRPVFPAISQYPIWGRTVAPQPVAARIGRQAINLPSGVCLRREEVQYISRTIRDILS